MSDFSSLKFFLVQNHEGKFLRAKGMDGHGELWVDEPEKAKVFPRIGLARSRVTFFANNSQGLPAPVIIELSVGTFAVLDEKVRIEKSKAKKTQAEAACKARCAEWELKRAQENHEKAATHYARVKESADRMAKIHHEALKALGDDR